MKTCKQCGEGPPKAVFSAHPATVDRLQPDCNSCKAAYQKELRLQRADETAIRNGMGYLERHQIRREQEALNCLDDPQPLEQEGYGFGKTETEFSGSGDGGFSSLMKIDPMLWKGKLKPQTSRA